MASHFVITGLSIVESQPVAPGTLVHTVTYVKNNGDELGTGRLLYALSPSGITGHSDDFPMWEDSPTRTVYWNFTMPSGNQTLGVTAYNLTTGQPDDQRTMTITAAPPPQTPAARLALAVAPPLILGAVLFYVSR